MRTTIKSVGWTVASALFIGTVYSLRVLEYV